MEQFLIDAFKSLGPAALPVGLLWWRSREMREDWNLQRADYEKRIQILEGRCDKYQQQLLDLTRDMIKSDAASTLVLEKIADKVGAA